MSDTFLDLINRREVSASQFATYLLKEYGLANLDDAYKAARLILLDTEEITSNTKLNNVVAEIKRTVTPLTAASNASITAELSAFGVAEATFAATTLAKFIESQVADPVEDKVIDYIEKSIMSLESGSSSVAGVWSDFVKDNTDNLTKTIVSQVKAGYSNQETMSQIVKRVKTATQGVSKNSIERLVRTGVAHYSQQANNYFRDDNLDLDLWEWPITTWDSRRSETCTSIEAKYGVNGSISQGWKAGKSPISYPPYHFRCRTIIRSLPRGATPEGLRPAIKGRKGQDAADAYDRKTGTPKGYTGRSDKAFIADQIPVDTKLSVFLRDSPYWYVKQLLGKTKADAFLAGKLDLSKLTDDKLRGRSLAELGLD